MSWKALTSIANIRNWEKLAKTTRHTRRYNRTCWLTTEKQYCIQGNFSTCLTLSSGGTFKTGWFVFYFLLICPEQKNKRFLWNLGLFKIVCYVQLWHWYTDYDLLKDLKINLLYLYIIPISCSNCFMFKLDTLTRV